MSEVERRYHWRDGNGALPFPGQRTELVYPSVVPGAHVYEVRETLGNEMVVSYRLAFADEFDGRIPEHKRWEMVRTEFLYYLEEPHG
jgi:hypothetical protein